MEKKNRFLITFFISVAVVSLAGFYTSYLSFFPDYSHFRSIIHIHFFAFLCWLVLIIVQPFLIRYRQYSLHKTIGKLSYLLAPILVATIIILSIELVQRQIADSVNNASVSALIGLLDIVSFSVYYVIAMVNRHNTRWHVAFIIAATLVVLNPGMSRLLNQINPGLGLLGAVLLPFIISISIVIYEKAELKKAILKSPYFLFFLCWTTEIILLVTLPSTNFWKNTIVKLFAPT